MKKNEIIKLILCFVVVVIGIFAISYNDDIFGKKEEEVKEETKDEFSYTPVMYTICDDDNCIYLVGTIHIGDDRIQKFSDKTMNAYKEMDSVAVEVDASIDNMSLNDFLLSSDESMDNILSEELINKLKEFSNRHFFFDYEQYKIYKPGIMYSVIDLLPFMEKGYLTPGADTYFVNLANKDNKNIIYLEEAEDQMKLLTDYSNEFYAKQIEYYIDNYDTLLEESLDLYETYISGDIDKLKELLNEEENSEELTEEEKQFNYEMLEKRNIDMTEKVEEFLDKDENVFVIVGAAHVLGNNGIIDALSSKNYKITLVK